MKNTIMKDTIAALVVIGLAVCLLLLVFPWLVWCITKIGPVYWKYLAWIIQ